ncbi:hypothetical protein OTU49_016031 [Cherax quadricarinatus]|uniref:Uncharacterized protein n=1 Tax=Cherax quadricarinatus TaxID=27406 RepID=A0AAW0YB39_CHEQU
MLSGCLYHRLESVLPPLIPKGNSQMVCMTKEDMLYSSEIGDQDFSRLEFLSACVIMKDEYTAHHLLPRVPHSFYPALFQAVMQKCYYSRNRMPGIRALWLVQ